MRRVISVIESICCASAMDRIYLNLGEFQKNGADANNSNFFWLLNELSIRPAENQRVATPSLCDMVIILVRHSRPDLSGLSGIPLIWTPTFYKSTPFTRTAFCDIWTH